MLFSVLMAAAVAATPCQPGISSQAPTRIEDRPAREVRQVGPDHPLGDPLDGVAPGAALGREQRLAIRRRCTGWGRLGRQLLVGDRDGLLRVRSGQDDVRRSEVRAAAEDLVQPDDGARRVTRRADELKIYDDALAGCAMLKAAGFLLVVISNQPDVGRGTLERDVADEINRRLVTAIPVLDRLETCYHAGERYGEKCDCRKPKPGMIRKAARKHNVDLAKSFVIGDRYGDVELAQANGGRGVLVRTGYGEEDLRLNGAGWKQQPDFVADDLAGAVDWILMTSSDSGQAR